MHNQNEERLLFLVSSRPATIRLSVLRIKLTQGKWDSRGSWETRAEATLVPSPGHCSRDWRGCWTVTSSQHLPQQEVKGPCFLFLSLGVLGVYGCSVQSICWDFPVPLYCRQTTRWEKQGKVSRVSRGDQCPLAALPACPYVLGLCWVISTAFPSALSSWWYSSSNLLLWLSYSKSISAVSSQESLPATRACSLAAELLRS